MFSLIISIISIALVAALAAATVYFGGAAFNKGSAGADASAFINAGQQIAGAFTLASADGYDVTIANLAQLNSGSAATGTNVYLSQIPKYKGDSLVAATNDTETTIDESLVYLTVNVESDQVCEEINKRANGVDGTGNVADVTAIEGLYGCITTGTTAFYKVK